MQECLSLVVRRPHRFTSLRKLLPRVDAAGAEKAMENCKPSSEKTHLFAVFSIILTLALINVCAAKASDGFTCAQIKPVGVGGMASVVSRPRLLELFPEMSSLLEATAFRVKNTWMGLSLHSPSKFEVVLALNGDHFEGEAAVSHGQEGRDTFQASKRNISVPRDAVRAFLCAVLQVPLEERAYEPYIERTDNYPDLSFTFQGQSGPIAIFTRSQPRVIQSQFVQTPWAISYVDRTFVVSAPDIDAALDGLDPTLFPKK
jgi:hypothetical protein